MSKKPTLSFIKITLRDLKDDPDLKMPDGSRRSSELLRVILTDAEKQTLGGDLANLQYDVKELTENKKMLTKDFDAKIAAKESAAESAANKIRLGYDMRQVQTVTFFDFPERGKKTTFRVDTGESIETRAMTDSEKERMLPGFEDGKAPLASGKAPDAKAEDKGDKAPPPFKKE